MACVVVVWAAGLYFVTRWFCYALKPLDYPNAPRWLCDPRKAWARRAMLAACVCLGLAWSFPMAALVWTAWRSGPWLIYVIVNLTLIAWGVFRFLDPPKPQLWDRGPGWLPVRGRWTPGLLIVMGLLGRAWQFAAGH